MASSRTRAGSAYIPHFDPYGYSPLDPRYEGDKGAGRELSQRGGSRGHDRDRDSHHTHSGSRRGSRVLDDDDAHGSGRHRSPATGGRRNSRARDDDDAHGSGRHRSPATGGRRNSRTRDNNKNNHREEADDDDDWDTDYDPRDRYYLSGDEKSPDYWSPSSKLRYTPDDYKSKPADRDGASDRDGAGDPDGRRRERHGNQSSSRSQNPPHSSSSSRHPLPRHDSSDRPTRRPGATNNTASASRPARPRAVSRYSSFGAASRAKPRQHPPNSSRSPAVKSVKAPKSSVMDRIAWDQVARTAVKAGAIAALKCSNQPGNWIGDKGTRVATAAIGAAVVDTFIAKKHPQRKGGIRHAAIRQVAELAIGSMVTGPAMTRATRRR